MVRPGPKRWRKSNRQQETEARLAELLRREAAHRKTLLGQLAYRILAIGKVTKVEKFSYRAFQRQFGRSVAVRAPGLFLAILRRKAESAGGRVIEFPAHKTRRGAQVTLVWARICPLSRLPSADYRSSAAGRRVG